MHRDQQRAISECFAAFSVLKVLLGGRGGWCERVWEGVGKGSRWREGLGCCKKWWKTMSGGG